MNAKRIVLWSGVVLAALAGCVPEKRVTWSPDGKWAAVRAGDGLYLCDAQGKLSPRVSTDATAVAWLSDSKRLLVAEATPIESWSAAAEALPPDRRAELEARALQLRDELLAIGMVDDVQRYTSLRDLTGGEAAALGLLVRERHAAELRPKLGEDWAKLEELRPQLNTLRVLSVADDGGVEGGAVAVRSLDGFDGLVVSPNDRHVAYTVALLYGTELRRLVVRPLGPGAARTVADGVGAAPAWSANGRELVYAACRGSSRDELQLGTINRRRVADDEGQLLAEFPEAVELAGIAFQSDMRMRCLRDGRILFASVELHLPAVSGDMPERTSLFVLDPERSPLVARVLPRQVEGALPDGLALFEVSPDERRICVPGSKGELVVVTLATGDTVTVAEARDGNEPRTLPVWRTADVLCFSRAVDTADARKPAELVLRQVPAAGGAPLEPQVLSRGWPLAAREGFLQQPPQTQPVEPTKAP